MLGDVGSPVSICYRLLALYAVWSTQDARGRLGPKSVCVCVCVCVCARRRPVSLFGVHTEYIREASADYTAFLDLIRKTLNGT